MVDVTPQMQGRPSVNDLAAALSEMKHVQAVVASDVNALGE